MKPRSDNAHPVIVKRRSKRGAHPAHGGAWKVAFADFTLAMMALFMVLWIVQPKADDERRSLSSPATASVFSAGAGVFDGMNQIPIELDGAPIAPPLAIDETAITAATGPEPSCEKAPRTVAAAPALADAVSPELLSLGDALRALAETSDALTNLEVQIVPQGLRILIKDDGRRVMFLRGSTQVSAHFQTLLESLAGVLQRVGNKLIVSGHTDSAPYRLRAEGGRPSYDNWNLSGERALRARGVLVDAGLPAQRFLQVAAQADTLPLLPLDTRSGRNRRVEILLLTEQAEGLYRELFGGEAVAYPVVGGS